MATLTVVKTLDVLKDDESGLLPAVENLTINAFPFESAEETLHRLVIVTVARSTHAHHDAYICQPGQISPAGVGTALIRVQKHLSGRRAPDKRHKDYVPILFDFDQPHNRDVTETVTTLARMARFIIADITDAKSIPQELAFIVPDLPSVPVKPLLLSSQREYGMFEHFTRFPWVLPVHHYTDQASLLQSLEENVIDPAEKKAQELAKQ